MLLENDDKYACQKPLGGLSFLLHYLLSLFANILISIVTWSRQR